MSAPQPFQHTHCLQCKKPLTGRIDKKYCDDYCRNVYNNRNKKADEKYIQTVNRIIRHNRKILKSLCPIGKAVVREEVLDSLGYNYHYFSGVYRASKGVYYICYDYAFLPTKETNRETGEIINKALIVQKQAYFTKSVPQLW
ncbi:MAG: DUF2116 family Zn-ribbon domain-containing protein [Fulvivirga sp.]